VKEISKHSAEFRIGVKGAGKSADYSANALRDYSDSSTQLSSKASAWINRKIGNMADLVFTSAKCGSAMSVSLSIIEDREKEREKEKEIFAAANRWRSMQMMKRASCITH